MHFLQSALHRVPITAVSREFSCQWPLEPLLHFVRDSPGYWSLLFAGLLILSSFLIARSWTLDTTSDRKAFWTYFVSRFALVVVLMFVAFSPAFVLPFLFLSSS
jgi:hypothetical protein